MAILIRCPKCLESYELENSQGGRKLACRCGRVFDLPVVDEGTVGNVLVCPDCGQGGDENRVICSSCGFNFKTGKKLVTESASVSEAEAEESVPFFVEYFHVIKLAVAAFVMLGIALAGMFFFLKSPYGISSSAPMGLISNIEPKFIEMGFTKEAADLKIPDIDGHKFEAAVYLDNKLKDQTRGMIYETVTIAHDTGSGAVVFIGSNFYPPSDAIPGGGTRVQRFTRDFWERQLKLAAPQFASSNKRKGLVSVSIESASVSSEKVKASWYKELNPMGLWASSDRVAMAYAALPDSVANSFMNAEFLDSDTKALLKDEAAAGASSVKSRKSKRERNGAQKDSDEDEEE